MLIRKRYSTINPGEVTGYAVGLTGHTTNDGAILWYGGGKLASDLTLPKLRARWAGPPTDECLGAPVHGVMARALLRARLSGAAEQASDAVGFFARLRESGVLVRLRFSEISPGEVTGYAVALPGYTDQDGAPRWYGGGRLAAELALPQLRRRWHEDRTGIPPRSGLFRFTAPERDVLYRHAARQGGAVTEQIRRSAGGDPAAAADTAWAAAATFHTTARAIRDPALRRAADSYDRAARAAYGKVPHRSTEGDRLRAVARLLSMISGEEDSATPGALTLVQLAKAVSELRQAQQHAAQAAAARETAERLYAAFSRSRAGATTMGPSGPARQNQSSRELGDAARLDSHPSLRPTRNAPSGAGLGR